MKTSKLLLTSLILLGVSRAEAWVPLGSAWTYQGRLNMNGSPLNGTADFQFRLWDAPALGNAIGAVAGVPGVAVAEGLFTVELDFGVAAHNGDERYLEISVRVPAGGAGAYTILSPRQRVAPSPYSIHSMRPWITDGNDIYFDGTFVGIGTDNPQFRLHVESTTPRAIYGLCTNASGNTTGIYGQSNSTGGQGVFGFASAATGTTTGAYGQSASATGRGVYGLATGTTGTNFGVAGEARGPFGSGVSGLATSNNSSATANGVRGESEAVFGAGVYGVATHATGVTYGVRGSATSPNGWAGYFSGRGYFSSNLGIGVSLLDGPLARLHVVNNGVQLGAAAIGGEDLLVEDTDAKLGLYSTDAGVGGSALSLAQVDSTFGNLLNKWSLIRETTSGGNGLRLTFGSDADAFGNATVAYFDDNGNIGFGTTAPQSAVHVEGAGLSMSASALNNDDMIIEDSDAVLGLYSGSGGTWASAVTLSRLNGNGGLVEKWAMAQRVDGALRFTFGSDANYANNSSIMALTSTGDVGIGTVSPAVRLHVNGGTDAELNGGGYLQLGASSGLNVVADNNEIMARNNGAAASLFLNNDGGDVIIAPQGTARVRVLEITGADLAERFPTRDNVEPGTVMEIDPDHPGKLRISRGAYNRRVAGVVSGAGDLPAGAILGNLPGSDGAPAIALSGRVWVRCDAAEHAIEIGDLLTTSGTPGHAMAAIDAARSHGAVIGKAMSRLSRGERGLVLVLVNLQ